MGQAYTGQSRYSSICHSSIAGGRGNAGEYGFNAHLAVGNIIVAAWGRVCPAFIWLSGIFSLKDGCHFVLAGAKTGIYP